MSVNILNNDVLINCIFTYLDQYELIMCSFVCKRWKNILKKNKINYCKSKYENKYQYYSNYREILILLNKKYIPKWMLDKFDLSLYSFIENQKDIYIGNLYTIVDVDYPINEEEYFVYLWNKDENKTLKQFKIGKDVNNVIKQFSDPSDKRIPYAIWKCLHPKTIKYIKSEYEIQKYREFRSNNYIIENSKDKLKNTYVVPKNIIPEKYILIFKEFRKLDKDGILCQ